jgi:membrane protease YdiL (CAAX protease family)
MPDAATYAVLRDCLIYIIIALSVGTAVYSLLRNASIVPVLGEVGQVTSQMFQWQEGVFACALIALLSSSLMVSESTAEGPTTAGEDVSSLLRGVGAMLFLTLLVVVFLRVIRRHDLVELFGLSHMSAAKALRFACLAMLPAWIVTSCAAVATTDILQAVWPDLEPQETVKSFQASESLWLRGAMIFAAVISAPLTEEILFRGFFYPVFKRFTDAWLAVPLNALLFALVHLHVGSFIPLFVLAVAIIIAYEITGCLLVPIFMHAMFNGVSILLLLSGIDLP